MKASALASVVAPLLPQPHWRDWTPTVTQGGSVTVNVAYARYAVAGEVCHIYASLTVTGSGTAGSAITIGGIPVAANGGYISVPCGQAQVYDASGTDYFGYVRFSAGTQAQFKYNQGSGVFGVDPNLGLANNDVIRFSASYETV